MRLLVVIIFGGCLFPAFSQSLKKDLSTMYQQLDALDAYRISVHYAAGDTASFFDQGDASVLINEEGFFYETEFATMIINPKHTIIINEEERTLIYSDNKKVKRNSESLSTYALQGLDTLVGQADSVYLTTSGDKRTYHLRFTNAYFDVIQVTFNGSYISNVLYFYNAAMAGEEGLTAICSISVDEKPVFDPVFFTSAYYLTEQNGKTVPTELFTGYTLVYNESIESYTE